MAKNKDTKKKKELTADDMRRLGMTEEDIARIIAERGKSATSKKEEQEKEEAQRRESEARARALKELTKSINAVVESETDPRVAILKEEDANWIDMVASLTVAKNRVVRAAMEGEAQRRTAEARKKREAELEAWKASLQSMSEEERQRLIAEQEEKERQRQEEILRTEEARQAKQRNKEARRLARAEKMRKSGHSEEAAYQMSLLSSDDEDSKSKQNSQQNALDELDFAMRERYEK